LFTGTRNNSRANVLPLAANVLGNGAPSMTEATAAPRRGFLNRVGSFFTRKNKTAKGLANASA
jgi:hypothetical protein